MQRFHKFRSVVHDAGFNHFAKQIISFPCAFANAGKHRKTCVGFSNIVDQFLDQDGFTNAGAAEQSDLTALRIGFDEVNDFDPGVQYFLRGGKVLV